MSPSQELRILLSTIVLVVGTCGLLVVAAVTYKEPPVPKAAEAVPFCLVPDARLFMPCGNKELSL